MEFASDLRLPSLLKNIRSTHELGISSCFPALITPALNSFAAVSLISSHSSTISGSRNDCQRDLSDKIHSIAEIGEVPWIFIWKKKNHSDC